ncbi:helix-turn-helix transcriptional regulator [Streptomyces sp. NPDC126497]|uniref:helix-turn-helix domain-containing protein n=1 Tax=Streptomyces sp. NPDC126497 TaxID=3155313 RepID=UPI0033197685
MEIDERPGPDTSLKDFLRARRAQLLPEDVGLPTSGRRRVPGLRREEVALLAGMSTDYYMRIEQGRERRPSAQVVEALVKALGLDEESAGHLRRLAHTAGRPARRTRRAERVDPHLRGLLERWDDLPAFVLGHSLDVLAANPLAAALHRDFTLRGNLAHMAFLDPVARRFYRQWDRTADMVVAELRKATGVDPDDPRLKEVVGELSVKSPAFRELWARHHVHGKTGGSKLLHHSDVGDLDLHYECFTVNRAPGQQLVIYQADPGSRSHDALKLLGTLDATPFRPDRPAAPVPSRSPRPGGGDAHDG